MNIKEKIEALLKRANISDLHIVVSIRNNGLEKSFVVGNGMIVLQINILPDRVSCFTVKKENYMDVSASYFNTLGNEMDAVEHVLRLWLFQNKNIEIE